jgi:hypothetical protein
MMMMMMMMMMMRLSRSKLYYLSYLKDDKTATFVVVVVVGPFIFAAREFQIQNLRIVSTSKYDTTILRMKEDKVRPFADKALRQNEYI